MKLSRMRALAFLTVTSALVCLGCDSKSSTGNQALDEAIEANEDKQAEMLERLDSGEGLEVDTEHAGMIADKLDEAAKDMSSADAQILRDQASTLREMQELVKPYEITLNTLLSMGGIDPASLVGNQSFDERIQLLNELIQINETMDAQLPALYRKLGGEPAVVTQTIDLVKKIRQTDRDLFPHMIGYLEVLKANWESVTPLTNGTIMFGEDVDDSVIQAFNNHADQINIITVQQSEYQRELVLLDQ